MKVDREIFESAASKMSKRYQRKFCLGVVLPIIDELETMDDRQTELLLLEMEQIIKDWKNATRKAKQIYKRNYKIILNILEAKFPMTHRRLIRNKGLAIALSSTMGFGKALRFGTTALATVASQQTYDKENPQK